MKLGMLLKDMKENITVDLKMAVSYIYQMNIKILYLVHGERQSDIWKQLNILSENMLGMLFVLSIVWYIVLIHIDAIQFNKHFLNI